MPGGGQPLLWQHLFWFFGHPEVYIAILPGMGATSHILATFARKPVFGYRAMVFAIFAIGLLGFFVWGHHMFMSGMSPYSAIAFSVLTLSIGVPSAVKTFNWLGTLWGGRIRFTVAMLFALCGLPNPVRAVEEMRRVCRPGGTIVIANHFRTDSRLLRLCEQVLSPVYRLLQYRGDLDLRALVDATDLDVRAAHRTNWFNYATVLVCSNADAMGSSRAAVRGRH